MILYLDFDGVLHHYDVYLDDRNRVHLRGMGELFQYAHGLERALAPYPKVKIVLSSNWIRVKGFGRSCKQLPTGLRKRIVGATWHSRMQRDEELLGWWNRSTRYEQIVRDVARRRPDDWLALDDDVHEWPAQAQNHLIACDPTLGLGEPSVRLALEERLANKFQRG